MSRESKSNHDPRSATAPVLFVHIPKTAGTALLAIAAAIYGRIPGAIGPEVFNIPLDWNGSDDDPDAVAAVRSRNASSLRYSSGHCSIRFRDHLSPDTRVITMLRDPVQRVRSAYANLRRDSENGYHEVAIRSTLEELLEARSLPEIDNGQVRRLAGIQPDAGPTDRSHLDLAIRNIDEEITAVGFTERFDESFQLFRTELGWPRRGYMPWNVAPTNDHRNQPSPELIALIAERNAYDIELYEHATRRFDARIAELGPTFQAEVERSRRFNSGWYRHWHRFGIVPFRFTKRKTALIRRRLASSKSN
ncbi:MAG: hypothetical protein CMJ23_14965 [Phycisphaerae bacterium]|nr:hypothetical protein [Phycisphaerae bacterium]